MEQYLNLVKEVIGSGTHKPNRTGVDTISSFSKSYTIDLQKGFPLLTTKDLSGFRWNSLIHEFIWYLSGEEHIRTLREETKIWDDWADEKGRLDTAYGRFWRRYPIPKESGQLDGETWANITDGRWEGDENIDPQRWLNSEDHEFAADQTFDQIQYVIDMIKENPNSRRLVVNAWHPANAAVSTLPPCHYTFVFNVQGNQLNCHLTQRSGDIALGVPFNIAAYSILTHVVAQRTGYNVGDFSHTIVDAHIYCGEKSRGKWYANNIETLQDRISRVANRNDYFEVKDWIENNAPQEEDGISYDHIPGLLRQLSREPKQRPTIEVADVPLDEISFDDIKLTDYNPHSGIDFEVAE